MPIRIQAHVAYYFAQPTDILLQMEAAVIPEQILTGPGLTTSPSEHFARIPGEAAIGERIWLRVNGNFTADYTIDAEVNRTLPDLSGLPALEPHQLPGETVPYLFDSRFCPSDRIHSFVDAEFAGTEGGERVQAIHDWVSSRFSYVPGSSTSTTTAIDSFVERRGVCRDYAHVVITLARASGIPARYVSCFAPNVEPQDFHAVAEVFLADPDAAECTGSWHLVDATMMADRSQMVKIGVGRDAAEVSFLTSYGMAQFNEKIITVEVI